MKNMPRRLISLALPTGLLLALATGVRATAPAFADAPDWLNSSANPSVTNEFQVYNYDTVGTDNSGCDFVTFRLSNSTTTNQCLVRVKSGQIGSGYYLPNNAAIGSTLNNNLFEGIPNTDEGYFLTSGSSGQWHLVLYPGIYANVKPNLGTGNQSYTVTLPNNADVTLADKSGAQFYVDPNTISFSSNGKWMVVFDQNALAYVSVNLQTLDVVPFAPATANPSSTSTAISDDGRYAAIHQPGTSQSFQIYDLSTCGTVPAHITTYVSCNSRNIQSYVAGAVPGFVNFQRIRFVTDYVMNIKAYGSKNGADTIEQYGITAPGLTAGQTEYLALGDSYSSGEGAGDYVQATNVAGTNTCHSSPNSYPDVIAGALGYTGSQFKTIACSGARSTDVSANAQFPEAPDSNSLGDWLPGLEEQAQHVAETQPRFMTMTMGGNDIGFHTIVEHCVADAFLSTDCYNSSQARQNLVNAIVGHFGEWSRMYSQLLSYAGSGATLYVIGYPQIVDLGNCGSNVWLTAQDIIFANELIAYLDYVIQQAAINAGAVYVDTQGALNGHELCQANTDLAVNGLTLARNGQPVSQESYHPTAYGEQLLAQSILNSTSDFTLTGPGPQPVTPPAPNDPKNPKLQALLNVPSGPVPIANTEQVSNGTDAFVSNIFQKSGELDYDVNGIDYGLRPNTSYTLTMHSDPTTIGTFTTDANGNLSISAPLPSSVEPGLHELDITGVGLSGENLDLVDTAFVDASPANLVSTGPTSQAPALSWDPVSGATSYDIYRDGTLAGTSTTTSYTDSGTGPGTYTYAVAAMFTGVEGSDSSPVAVTYDPDMPDITNFTSNDGTTFARQNTPNESGIASQTINADGSITVSVSDAAGNADSGFYLGTTTLGELSSFSVSSSSGDFGLNLWFDNAGLGDFFQWDNRGQFTGAGGDTYGVSPGSANGSIDVTADTSIHLAGSGQDYTLAQLTAGDDTADNITSDTPVAVWIGVDVTEGGSASATISQISDP